MGAGGGTILVETLRRRHVVRGPDYGSGVADARQGAVHVTGPEQGATLPGKPWWRALEPCIFDSN